jgi:hypothetical protein
MSNPQGRSHSIKFLAFLYIAGLLLSGIASAAQITDRHKIRVSIVLIFPRIARKLANGRLYHDSLVEE